VKVKIIHVVNKEHTLPVQHAVTFLSEDQSYRPDFKSFKVPGSTAHKSTRYLVESSLGLNWMSEGEIVRTFGKKVFKTIKRNYFDVSNQALDEVPGVE
jgi:hypothetical protein